MVAIFESNSKNSNEHFTLQKYKNLANLPHYHNEHILIHIGKGSAEIIINNVLYVIHGGESVFAYANDIHSIKSDNKTVVSVIKADTDYFDDLFFDQRLYLLFCRTNTFHQSCLMPYAAN